MLAPELKDRLDAYLIMWHESRPAGRVDQVEGFSINHGFEEYEGQTIPEFITVILNDLLLFLAERPELLNSVMTDAQRESIKKKVDTLLHEEEAKVDEANKLFLEMQTYPFKMLDPRWRKARDRYHAVVKSFHLRGVDNSYL